MKRLTMLENITTHAGNPGTRVVNGGDNKMKQNTNFYILLVLMHSITSCVGTKLHQAYQQIHPDGKVIGFLYFDNDSFYYNEVNSKDSICGVFELVNNKELILTESLHLSNIITSKIVEKYDSTLIDSIAFVISMKNLNNMRPCMLTLYLDSDSLDLFCYKSIKIKRPNEFFTIKGFYLNLAYPYYTDVYEPIDNKSNVFEIKIDEAAHLMYFSGYNRRRFIIKNRYLVLAKEKSDIYIKNYKPRYAKLKVLRLPQSNVDTSSGKK